MNYFVKVYKNLAIKIFKITLLKYKYGNGKDYTENFNMGHNFLSLPGKAKIVLRPPITPQPSGVVYTPLNIPAIISSGTNNILTKEFSENICTTNYPNNRMQENANVINPICQIL